MEPKKLRRSATDKVFAGVCGGFGNYFGLDPVLIRLAWALCCLLAGTGLVAYIVCAIIIPEENNIYSDF
ncbi:MAG: PspC domain-containing protein [Lachnospiraceae bacterium]|nr:PspC domain-containing protein [Lachnospiraceae bacterium]